MHPVLGRTLAAIDAQTAGLTPADFERHPPGKWSSANSLEHLSLPFSGTGRALQKCLATGQPRATRPSFRHD